MSTATPAAIHRAPVLHIPARLRPGGLLALGLTAALLGIAPAKAGQVAGVNQGGPAYVHSQAESTPMPQSGMSESARKIEQMRQAERQQHLVADSARLLQLSTELKSQIDQASKDQLSLDTLRKAAEIEKLAHDLKGWLKS